MVDLTTNFCNIKLKNPIILASSPATETLENIIQAYKAGIAAVIIKSAADYDKNKTSARRVVFLDDVYYATSTFERETLTINEACELIRSSRKYVDIPIFASLAIIDFNQDKIIKSCISLEKSGAKLIQIDLFYMPQPIALEKTIYWIKNLIKILNSTLNIPVVPKLNIEIPAYLFSEIFTIEDTYGVFFLDSVRVSTPIDNHGNSIYSYHINPSMSSVFGSWQKYITNHYLTVISKKTNFDICAGGGYYNVDDIYKSLMSGASCVMLASKILLDGYKSITILLNNLEKQFKEFNVNTISELQELKEKQTIDGEKNKQVFLNSHAMINIDKCIYCEICNSQTFCNAYDGIALINLNKCDGCSFCVELCPENIISIVDN